MEVFGVNVQVEFAAAHHIRGYDGDCARPHGHNYKVEVKAIAPRLNSIGIAVDFKELKSHIRNLTNYFDHQDINTLEPFTELNPTAETLAEYFYKKLKVSLKNSANTQDLQLQRVTVWENEHLSAWYGIATSE